MSKVVIYSSNWCPFCIRAKSLLSNKSVDFEEIRVDGKPDIRAQMAEKAKRTSVPQIWIGELHVGGCMSCLRLSVLVNWMPYSLVSLAKHLVNRALLLFLAQQ